MILVDFDMICHRCYRAMDDLCNSKGVKTGMEYGVMRVLRTLGKRIADNPNETIVLCFEGFDDKTQKVKPGFYKANREKLPESFYSRKSELQDNLTKVYSWAMGIGHEADQIMHTLSLEGKQSWIFSNDKDMFQSISSTTLVVRSFRNKLYFWDEDKLFEKHKVRPRQYAYFKCMVGDSSDNIPGIPRIQKVWAAEIARRTDAYHVKEMCMLPLDAFIACLKEHAPRASSKLKDNMYIFIENQAKINLDLIKFKKHLHVGVNESTGESIKDYLAILEIKTISYDDETEF